MLSPQYNPHSIESFWIKHWEEKGYFKSNTSVDSLSYSVLLPPPNVTGTLHMGHALGNTLQDILVRFHRMKSYQTTWIPGLDHAGIATQMLVEKHLKKTEGKTRQEMGREAFLDAVWAWKEDHGNRILDQMKLMGLSLDWARQQFTMDAQSVAMVTTCFVKLYEEGLIYRAERLVNWCCDCETAVSDLEVDTVEQAGHLWTIKYPLVDGAVDEMTSIVVATTRPETMFGDTAVAVHPDDERYNQLIGKKVRVPLVERDIPIIGDSFVDPKFGSGVVKITPGHDFTDFECGERHNLDIISVIDHKGCLKAPAPDAYIGMTVEKARHTVVATLERAGQIDSIEEHTMSCGHCQRSGTVLEPLVSKQWWVSVKKLAQPAIDAVESGETTFYPEHWTKTYMHWMNNIKDWCISRQLWWGHQIPAWHCRDCSFITVTDEPPTQCAQCESKNITQDEDVLDTWFSSALWPLTTVGWSENNTDFLKLYPFSVLVTGPDILFFWVARMMMMGLHFADQVPFKRVFFTPIVTDEQGQKMSKVKGNVIDPLAIIYETDIKTMKKRLVDNELSDETISAMRAMSSETTSTIGVDALRFSLTAMTVTGRHVRLSLDRIEGYRHFVNKLWNASRFALMNIEQDDPKQLTRSWVSDRPLVDRWIRSRLQRTIQETDNAFETFHFADAANLLYQFVWKDFCDWYIETIKSTLRQQNGNDQELLEQHSAKQTMILVLDTVLRLLHPIMPFVTEEIWQKLPPLKTTKAESLAVVKWPSFNDVYIDEDAERDFALIQLVIAEIRSLRSQYRVPPSKQVNVFLYIPNIDDNEIITAQKSIIERVANALFNSVDHSPTIEASVKGFVKANIEIVVVLEGLIDIDKERSRIEKELTNIQESITMIEDKLNNKQFVTRAPVEVVEEKKIRLNEEQQRYERLENSLNALQ